MAHLPGTNHKNRVVEADRPIPPRTASQIAENERETLRYRNAFALHGDNLPSQYTKADMIDFLEHKDRFRNIDDSTVWSPSTKVARKRDRVQARIIAYLNYYPAEGRIAAQVPVQQPNQPQTTSSAGASVPVFQASSLTTTTLPATNAATTPGAQTSVLSTTTSVTDTTTAPAALPERQASDSETRKRSAAGPVGESEPSSKARKVPGTARVGEEDENSTVELPPYTADPSAEPDQQEAQPFYADKLINHAFNSSPGHVELSQQLHELDSTTKPLSQAEPDEKDLPTTLSRGQVAEILEVLHESHEEIEELELVNKGLKVAKKKAEDHAKASLMTAEDIDQENATLLTKLRAVENELRAAENRIKGLEDAALRRT